MEPYRNLPYNLGMDSKKKIEETYMPDKSAQKERVLVGLNGGIDSMVAAYLLKIQKYELFAVTLVPTWDQYSGDRSDVLSCALSDERVEKIRDFCQNLKIPHHTVKLTSEFTETVVEKWVADKLSGSLVNACWGCHDLRMNVLYQKMKELGAKKMATGHFAKIFHYDSTDSYFVHSSNDEEFDQSSLLSRLSHSVLSSLILPLSDLTRKEVLKLAENFGLESRPAKIQRHHCFPENERTREYLNQHVPARYLQPGEIVNEDRTENFGEHEGAAQIRYGQELELQVPGLKTKLHAGKFILKESKLVAYPADFFLHKRVLLVNCQVSEGSPWVEPMKGAILMADHTFIDCWIYPKSLNAALVEWEGEQRVLEGSILTVYRKKGKNAKVYFTGKVHFLPPEKEEPEEHEEKAPSVDYTRDF